jgi:hypothetical protein
LPSQEKPDDPIEAISPIYLQLLHNTFFSNDFIFVVGKMGISLTNLRHVDRGGLSREQQDGQQQEERVPSRDCETTKNHLAVVMSRMQRTTD